MNDASVFESVLETLPKNAHHRRGCLELVRCFASIERGLMQHFAHELNSSLPRYDVQTALELNPKGLTMGELASMLTVTKGNITGVVRRLKENGLVRKVILKSDRRMQSVTISGKGRLWDRMHADYDSIISRILSAQTEKELRSLTRTLKKTRAAVEEISSELWGLDNIHG